MGAGPLAPAAGARDPAGVTAPEDPRARFRSLPQPVDREDTVETVDASVARPAATESDERDRLLREAGG